jgi:hypothetical protein
MLSVPPDTGVPADELLAVGEDVDDELHAARARAAAAATASPADRLGILIMGMFLLVRTANENKAAIWRPRAADHYLTGETVRSGQRNPD